MKHGTLRDERKNGKTRKPFSEEPQHIGDIFVLFDKWLSTHFSQMQWLFSRFGLYLDVMCSVLGYAHSLFIYTEKKNKHTYRYTTHIDIEAIKKANTLSFESMMTIHRSTFKANEKHENRKLWEFSLVPLPPLASSTSLVVVLVLLVNM